MTNISSILNEIKFQDFDVSILETALRKDKYNHLQIFN